MIYMAAPHIHSAWSDDASWSLGDIAAAFGERGYDVVLLCEHSREFNEADLASYFEACAEASTPEMLLVPGIEYNDPENLVHITVWGDVPFFGHTPQIADLLAEVNAEGGVSVLAHPWRRDAWQRYDSSWTPHLAAIEVWNRKYDGLAPNRRAIAMARKAGVAPFVSLDFHTSRQFFPLGMALRIDDSRPLSRESVYDALRSGAFEPRVFDRSARYFVGGPALPVLELVERSRRMARGRLRNLRRER
jgi:predicted metal-dependent phosphoesterase TrpH